MTLFDDTGSKICPAGESSNRVENVFCDASNQRLHALKRPNKSSLKIEGKPLVSKNVSLLEGVSDEPFLAIFAFRVFEFFVS